MKLIHYSRTGYDGNYLYTSVCGKQVKTHQDKEDTTIHPEEANCKTCLNTKEHQIDLADTRNTKVGIKRRIYIESDILHADEFRSNKRIVRDFAKENGLPYVDRIFSQVLDFAWHDLEKTWQAVKDADEIYADSSLMPLSGGSYMGAPVIFNEMMKRTIAENLTGKSVYILREQQEMYMDMIDKKLISKALKHNKLYFYDWKNGFVEADLTKLKKQH